MQNPTRQEQQHNPTTTNAWLSRFSYPSILRVSKLVKLLEVDLDQEYHKAENDPSDQDSGLGSLSGACEIVAQHPPICISSPQPQNKLTKPTNDGC